MGDLTGKVALVTGGSRGIGAAIALRLAREGAAVALTYATAADKAQAVAKQIDADGGRALVIRADNADPAAVVAAALAITAGGRSGRLATSGKMLRVVVDAAIIAISDQVSANLRW